MIFPDPAKFSVKICGITTREQASAIVALGADALGLNFWPKSKRYLDPASAIECAAQVKGKAALVAVLVNATDDQLREVLDLGLIDVLQLHGDESPAECERVRGLGLPVIKALQVRDRDSLRRLGDYTACDTLLLDAYCPGLYGGEGKTFPWELAIEAKQMFPGKHFILAGGLTPENVGIAIATVRPWGVDVASGVESSPGRKDARKLRAFIKGARAAETTGGYHPYSDRHDRRDDTQPYDWADE